MHCAIQSSKAPDKRKEVILLLLSKGKANASLGDSYGSIPYDYCDDDDTDLKDLLQPIVPPIFKALLDQNEEQLESILKEQPSATETRHLSKTPLMVVVEQLLSNEDTGKEMQVQLLEILLKHGAKPDATLTANREGHLLPQGNENTDPPLYQVCLALKDAYNTTTTTTTRSTTSEETKSIQTTTTTTTLERAAQVLFDHGAIPGEATQFLLHDAARRGYINFFDFLVSCLQININTPGRQGMTPLHFCARSGKMSMVQHILTKYPQVNYMAKDDRGQTALDAAKANEKDDIVALLTDKLDALSSS